MNYLTSLFVLFTYLGYHGILSQSLERAYLVESLPQHEFEASLVEDSYLTHETLIRLINNVKSTLDITVMYFDLVTSSASLTEKEKMYFGANHGKELYSAFQVAASRGVHIRFLMGSGVKTPEEVNNLIADYPNHITAQFWEATEWYGSGIMHQKMWIFDKKSIYIGSSNMDWKSLTQVKELGVVVENNVLIAEQLQVNFDIWWNFTSIDTIYPSPNVTDVVNDGDIPRSVPAWSPFVSSDVRQANPLIENMNKNIYIGNKINPLSFVSNGDQGEMFLAVAPKAVQYNDEQTWDSDALVFTIDDASEFVHLSVMDFIPYSLYGKGPQVYWPALNDAIIRAVTSRGVHVRLLIAKWAHSKPIMEASLRALQGQANSCRYSKYSFCKGSLEIRYFIIPGWENSSIFPEYTRVNHAKYIVTDKRVNIGTSNMLWDYFYQTAGASFNTNFPKLLNQAQKIFVRDWESKYAFNLDHQVTYFERENVTE